MNRIIGFLPLKFAFTGFALCVILLLVSCASTPADERGITVEIAETPRTLLPARVGTASMDIQSLDSSRAVIVVTLEFENPNRVEIPVPRLTYNYLLSRISFIRGIVESEQSLAAASVTPVSFRLLVSYPDLFRSIPFLRNLSEVASLLTIVCEYENINMEIAGILPIRR